jgi:hypothetical protein
MFCMDGVRTTLAGRYELGEVIGRGGMGTVYRATDLVLKRTVAVKVLPAALADADPTHVARFEREARAAASLNHPGVVAVYDTGVDEATRFIVMECVTGRDLAAILREQAPLEPARAVSIAERVADALAAAHAAGIVHRDVKPANVMVAEDGSVKVLDFGIARALDGATLTHGASVLGSAAYMAPEQALGERADERSDIYSLGCVLYAMLTGRPPFTGEAAAAVLHQHVNAETRPPSQINPRVPPALDALVIAMLAKAPDARPQSAAQLRGRLAAMPGELPTTPAMAPTAPTMALEQTAVTRALAGRAPANAGGGARARRHRLAAAAVLGGCALLVAVIVALATGGGSPHSPPATTHRSTASKRPSGTTRPSAVASPTASTAAVSPSATTTTTKPTTATGGPPAPATVPGSAGALTTLITRDVEAGSIEQHAAQQITNELTNILNSYEMGHTMNLPHELANLTQQVAMLEGEGQISPAAAAPLHGALANLDTALAESPPETQAQAGQPPGQTTEPPRGHGGLPPGQAKKHDGSHGDSHGD